MMPTSGAFLCPPCMGGGRLELALAWQKGECSSVIKRHFSLIYSRSLYLFVEYSELLTLYPRVARMPPGRQSELC